MHRSPLTLLAAALLLAACDDDPKADDTGTAGDGGATDDGGATGDGGATDDGSACSDYAPVDQVGTTWTWQITDEGEAAYNIGGTWTSTATGATTHEGRDVWEVATEGSYTSPSYESYTWTTTTWYVCDDEGVRLSGYETSYEYVVSGTTYEGTDSIVYTTMPLTMPRTLAVGDTWTSTSEYETGDGGTTQTYSVDYEVTGSETATVPAGTWEALRVHPSNGADFLVVKGIGVILNEGYAELVSVD